LTGDARDSSSVLQGLSAATARQIGVINLSLVALVVCRADGYLLWLDGECLPAAALTGGARDSSSKLLELSTAAACHLVPLSPPLVLCSADTWYQPIYACRLLH
jgi:hypothetical protein